MIRAQLCYIHMWCEKHAELFKSNGISPEDILNKVVNLLSVMWKKRTGLNMKTDEQSVKMVMRQFGRGKPFCCHLGDEKLKKILVNVSTDVERKRYQDANG